MPNMNENPYAPTTTVQSDRSPSLRSTLQVVFLILRNLGIATLSTIASVYVLPSIAYLIGILIDGRDFYAPQGSSAYYFIGVMFVNFVSPVCFLTTLASAFIRRINVGIILCLLSAIALFASLGLVQGTDQIQLRTYIIEFVSFLAIFGWLSAWSALAAFRFPRKQPNGD
jgi:hypothetical protein